MKILRRLVILVCVVLPASVSMAWLPGEWKDNIRQYVDQGYASVEASPLSTGILYDLALPMSRIESFDGSETAPAMTIERWRQIAFELRRASLVESRVPAYTRFHELGRTASRDRVISIGFLFFNYQRIRPGLAPDSVFKFDGQRLISIQEDAFDRGRVLAAAPLYPVAYRGEDTHFQVDLKNLFFTNDSRAVKKLQVDFDDGAGFRTVSSGNVVAHYTSTGMKTLRFRLTLSDGTVLHAGSFFQVMSLRTPAPTDTLHLQAALPYNGEYATGDAYIYLSAEHSVLTRPLLVSEGFDIDNTMNWDELYDLLNQQNLIEDMRAMGYDAVVLNYTNAITYLQANAFLVEKMLDSVSTLIEPGHTVALAGASMGGLTTRYALTHMEANQHPPHVRTWISFDSPQNGANIPLGLQYWVSFFADQSSDAAFLRDALNSPAARQMLLAHFTDPPSGVASPDPLFGAFQTDLAQLGSFPAQPRRVAIANGSGYQNGMDFNPGDQLIYYQYRSWLVDIDGNVWALNNAQPQLIFDGMINQIWPLPDTYMSATVQPTWPWDNAPGGMRASMAQMDSVDPGYGDIIALHNNHCFIPTISSLGLDVSDPFYDIAGDPDLYSHTFFDSLYFPAENQPHVEITPENYWWFLQEAVDSLPAPVVVIHEETGLAHLNWPRVPGARSYQIYASDDPEAWPPQYVLTADTLWTDTDDTSLMKFYQVRASFEPPAALRLSRR